MTRTVIHGSFPKISRHWEAYDCAGVFGSVCVVVGALVVLVAADARVAEAAATAAIAPASAFLEWRALAAGTGPAWQTAVPAAASQENTMEPEEASSKPQAVAFVAGAATAASCGALEPPAALSAAAVTPKFRPGAALRGVLLLRGQLPLVVVVVVCLSSAAEALHAFLLPFLPLGSMSSSVSPLPL